MNNTSMVLISGSYQSIHPIQQWMDGNSDSAFSIAPESLRGTGQASHAENPVQGNHIYLDQGGPLAPTEQQFHAAFDGATPSVVLLMQPIWTAITSDYANELFSGTSHQTVDDYVTANIHSPRYRAAEIIQSWINLVGSENIYLVIGDPDWQRDGLLKCLAKLGTSLNKRSAIEYSNWFASSVWDIRTLKFAEMMGIYELSAEQRALLGKALALWQLDRFDQLVTWPPPAYAELNSLTNKDLQAAFTTLQPSNAWVQEMPDDSSIADEPLYPDSTTFIAEGLEPLVTALSTKLTSYTQLVSWQPGNELASLQQHKETVDQLETAVLEEEASLKGPIGMIKKLFSF